MIWDAVQSSRPPHTADSPGVIPGSPLACVCCFSLNVLPCINTHRITNVINSHPDLTVAGKGQWSEARGWSRTFGGEERGGLQGDRTGGVESEAVRKLSEFPRAKCSCMTNLTLRVEAPKVEWTSGIGRFSHDPPCALIRVLYCSIIIINRH